MTHQQSPWFVDLFAGCGGLSKGFVDAGFQHLVANEIWPPAADTYELNISQEVVRGSICDPKIFEDLVQTAKDHEPLVVIGGPPCQGFSIAGNRNPLDPRGQLWKNYINFLKETQPVAFVMENVKGLQSIKHIDINLSKKQREKVEHAAQILQRGKDLKRYAAQRELSSEEQSELLEIEKNKRKYQTAVQANLVLLLPQIISELQKTPPGYEVRFEVLNAANYGVPQMRKRIIIIGIRADIYEEIKSEKGSDFPFHPAPQYFDFDQECNPIIPKEFCQQVQNDGDFRPFKTVREAIEDLSKMPEIPTLNHVFMKSKQEFIAKIE